MAALVAAIVGFVFTGYYLILITPFIVGYFVLMGINWKAAYWVLLFFIPASVHIDILHHSLAITLPDEPMMWLFLLLLIIVVAYQPTFIPQWWWFNPISIIVLFQFLWLIVAVVYSNVLFFSIKFLLAKAWYLTCFFILPLWIFREKKDFRKGFIIVLIPLLVTMVIIFCRHTMLGFKFRNINDAIGLLYYNHVEYATILSMFFPLLCMAYPLTKGMKKSFRILLIVIILFFTLLLFLAYARAAILAVVFAGVIGLAIRYKVVNYIMPCFYGLLVFLMVYMVQDNRYINFKPSHDHTIMHETFTEHVISAFRGQDESTMERFYRWIAAIRMSNEHPITGYGPHSFFYYYKPYTVSLFKTFASQNIEHSTTHNYFLYMLVEQGIPAMLLYSILIVVVFAMAQRTYHRFTDNFYKNCTLGLAMLFAACFVNNFFSELIETHKVGPLFYLSISLLVILRQKSKLSTPQ
jgi:O-antigen ligase